MFYAWLCAVSVWVWRSRGGSSSLSPENNPRSAASTASKSAVQQMSAICDRSAGAKSSSDVDHIGKLLLTWLVQFRHDRKTKSVDQTSSKN